MDIVSAVVVYILLWWWVLFMVLPFGAKAPEQIETGHASIRPRTSADDVETGGYHGDLSWVVCGCLSGDYVRYIQFP